jgi:CheY-like chemotaxis protein
MTTTAVDPQGCRYVKTILVADDNTVSRELVREALEDIGYRVIEAADGGEALTKAIETRPDLALLDIRMPVLDGYATLRALRADRHPDDGALLLRIGGGSDTEGRCGLHQYTNLDRLATQRTGKLIDEARRRQRALQLENDMLAGCEFEGMVGNSPLMWEL